jgi:anti-sigma-K factor RskA
MNADLHHLCGAYAVDALDDAERVAFEQHLAGCADCRAEVAELSAAAHSLGALTETTPPPSLRASVLSGISQVRPLPPLREDAVAPVADGVPAIAGGHESPEPDAGAPDGVVVPLRRRSRVSTWLAAAAAAAVIAVGGAVWSPWSDDAGTLSPVDQVAAAADAMRVTSTKGQLNAEVAYSRQLGRAAITVQGLPPAPDGKTYQLWFVGADEIARSAGLLTPGEDGRGSMVLDGHPNSAAAVGLTLEPEGGSTRPTTDPLVVLALA